MDYGDSLNTDPLLLPPALLEDLKILPPQIFHYCKPSNHEIDTSVLNE